jgi:hypothetical protein
MYAQTSPTTILTAPSPEQTRNAPRFHHQNTAQPTTLSQYILDVILDVTLAALLTAAAISTKHALRDHVSTMTAALPKELVAVIFTALVLALAWTVLVWLVHTPPSGWAVVRWLGGGKGEDGYQRIESKEDDEGVIGGDQGGAESAACASALEDPMHRDGDGDGGRAEGQSVRRRRIAYSTPSPLPASKETRHERGVVSPQNPFLTPPGRKGKTLRVRRSSEDWVAEHQLFFAAATALDTDDDAEQEALGLQGCELEALEAQTAMPRPTVDGGRRRRAGWMDRGLEMVDGAVDSLVGKIVKWTDDNGEDEVLLLPLTKGEADRVN